MLDGVTISLGGQDYVLPPLNLAALERYWPVIESWAQPPTSLAQRLGEAAELLHAALARNYPDLELASVKEGLDLVNVPALLQTLLAVSGLARREPGEPEAGSVPTGATSRPGSSAKPAGRGNTWRKK